MRFRNERASRAASPGSPPGTTPLKRAHRRLTKGRYGDTEAAYFTHDQRNQLRQIHFVGSGTTHYFHYNGVGERVAMVGGQGGMLPTYLSYNAPKILTERDETGFAYATYRYAPTGEPVDVNDAEVGAASAPVSDANASVNRLVGVSGGRIYDTFGVEFSNSISSFARTAFISPLFQRLRGTPFQISLAPVGNAYLANFGIKTVGAPQLIQLGLMASLLPGRLGGLLFQELPGQPMPGEWGPPWEVPPDQIPSLPLRLLRLFTDVPHRPYPTPYKGVCGPEIGEWLVTRMRQIKRSYDAAGYFDQVGLCDAIDLSGALKFVASTDPKETAPQRVAAVAWNVCALIETEANMGFWTNSTNGKCATGDCSFTVMVFGHCYRPSVVNYMMWGLINSLCNEYRSTADDFRRSWKRVNYGYYDREYDVQTMQETGYNLQAVFGRDLAAWSSYIETWLEIRERGRNPRLNPEVLCGKCEHPMNQQPSEEVRWIKLPRKPAPGHAPGVLYPRPESVPGLDGCPP